MYYFSDRPEDMKQVVGWIDLTKMLGVERTDDHLSFIVRTTGRVYALAVPAARGDVIDSQNVLAYWVGGLTRWKQLICFIYLLSLLLFFYKTTHFFPPTKKISPGFD